MFKALLLYYWNYLGLHFGQKKERAHSWMMQSAVLIGCSGTLQQHPCNQGKLANMGHCRCPIPGGIQGQAGWGFEQPGLEGGVPAYSRGLELDDLKGPFQPKPFYDSTILWIACSPSDASIWSFDLFFFSVCCQNRILQFYIVTLTMNGVCIFFN